MAPAAFSLKLVSKVRCYAKALALHADTRLSAIWQPGLFSACKLYHTGDVAVAF